MLPLLPLLALLARPALGQLFLGKCPRPELETPLNSAMLTGNVWYEQRRYFAWLEQESGCVNFTFTSINQTTFRWTTNMTTPAFERATTISEIKFKDPNTKRAHFQNKVTKLPGFDFGLPGLYDFRIISLTADHLVAWACHEVLWWNSQDLWIMTSSRHPRLYKVTAALTAAKQKGLNIDLSELTGYPQYCEPTRKAPAPNL